MALRILLSLRPKRPFSADGLTLWSVFSVYGEGGKHGIKAHDKFNLIKATLTRIHFNGKGQP